MRAQMREPTDHECNRAMAAGSLASAQVQSGVPDVVRRREAMRAALSTVLEKCRFSPNDPICVKLTVAGRRAVLARVDAFNRNMMDNYPQSTVRESMPPERDGVISVTAWEVFSWFGPYCGIGQEVPFEWIEKA